MVNWCEAVAFCRWLSHLLGYEVRLPTEQEWEKAAWEDGFQSGFANRFTGGDVGRYKGHTTAVGIYPQGASPYEVLDLAGNVWEWCLNKYDHPEDTNLDRDDLGVRRGGSWYNFQDHARAAFRIPSRPDYWCVSYGFRVARCSLI